jgi:hypothetical protein
VLPNWARVREVLDRTFTPRVILVIAWLLFVIYAYPGYMSYDSVWQLMQGRGLEPRNEWQPPLMAWMWGVLDAIIAGPFLMLVLQSTAFLLGTWGVLKHVMSSRKAAIVTAIVLLAPANIVVMGVIWKDCQMAGYLLAATALLLSRRRGYRIFGYFLLFLATGVRYNAVAPTFPIVLGLFALYREKPMSRIRRLVLATSVWFGITVAALLVNSMLVETKLYPWQTAGAPLEIAGVIRYGPTMTDQEILDATPGVPWLHKDRLQWRIRTNYRATNSYLDITNGKLAIIEYIKTEEQREAIANAWKNLVSEYPIPFARHRYAVLKANLRVHTGGAHGFWVGFTNADWGEKALSHKAHHGDLQRFWIEHLVDWDEWFGLRVWVYMVLSLAFLPLCKRSRLAFVLLMSGVLHMVGLLLLAPAIDYRYSHWMVVCTMIGGIVLFVTRLRRSTGEPAPR